MMPVTSYQRRLSEQTKFWIKLAVALACAFVLPILISAGQH